MSIYIIIITGSLLLAVGLIALLSRMVQMREEVVKKGIKRAQKKIEQGKHIEAENKIYKAIRAVGWDYQRFLQRRKLNKLASIKQTETIITKICRLIGVLPKNNFHWVAEALYFLSELYRMQEKKNKRQRLFIDLRNFIDDYGYVLSRFQRADLLSRIDREEAFTELEARNYRGAIRLEASHYLHVVEKLYAEAQSQQLQDMIPYKGSELLDQALEAIDQTENKEELCQIVQAGIVDGGARVDLKRVHVDLDGFLIGRRTSTDKEREMARMMLQKVLEKAEKEEEPGEDPEPEDNGVIHL